MSGADDQLPPTWVFARDSTTIRVRRLPGRRLHIDSNAGQERLFTFDNVNELTAFHCGFEQHLVATGWSLIEFGPERRTPGSSAGYTGPERRRKRDLPR